MKGWIKVHRQVFDNEFYFAEKFTKAQAWIDLLLLANHHPATLFIRGNEIRLKAGDLCYSQLSLATRWKWNFKTVNKFLEMLSARDMIKYKGGKVTTVITILNWEIYQNNGVRNKSFTGEQNEIINKGLSANNQDTNGEQICEKKENRMQNRMETNNKDENVKKIHSEEFESFWNLYNKKVDREKSLKKWIKLAKSDKEKIFSTLPNYISKTLDIQYRKNPLTYLNGKCWNDEFEIINNNKTLEL